MQREEAVLKNVHLSLRKTEGAIELIIQDKGQGFDLEEVLSQESSGKGSGLASMREHAELSGGTFNIESVEGGRNSHWCIMANRTVLILIYPGLHCLIPCQITHFQLEIFSSPINLSLKICR